MSFYVELIQTDPEGTPSAGCGHYAGELTGFATAEEARQAGLPYLGKPVPDEAFHPCCDWQLSSTPVTGTVVYYEDAEGNRREENPICTSLKQAPVDGGYRCQSPK